MTHNTRKINENTTQTSEPGDKEMQTKKEIVGKMCQTANIYKLKKAVNEVGRR